MSQYPTTPIFATIGLTSTQPALISRAQSGKRYARRTDGHLWTFTASYSMLTRAEFMPVFGFGIAQDGEYGVFTVIPPDLAVPQGTALGSPVVNGAAQVGSSLVINGCTADQTAFFKEGDVFTVAGDLKVYMITEVIPSDSGGNATLIFKPPLEKVPADAAVITVSDVEFTMSFVGGARKYAARPPLLYNYEVDMIEAL